MATIPIVGYLDIEGPTGPRLVAQQCSQCGALYLERRNGCGRCGPTAFRPRPLATTGTVRAYTIVHRGAPGVAVPFVSLLVDLDGGGVVKGNLLGVPPSPEHIPPGLRVRLTTYEAATDDEGTTAVAFAFEPEREEGA